MPALAICLIFIAYLFYTDLKRPDRPSAALWVPLIWMFLAGSRWVSSWFSLGPTFTSSADYAEGSPIDAAVFTALIVAGLIILIRRNLDWSALLRQNLWIVLYLVFCLASFAWSDEPGILAKRWVKDLGNPIMALVILTEQRPYEAVGVVLRRLGFLLLPLSVLFIRYFPELGRSYRPDGSPMFTGVGHQKNDLGQMCLLVGIYACWELFRPKAERPSSYVWRHRVISGVMIAMLLWLLRMSDSQTSVVCLVTAAAILFLGRLPMMARRPDMIFAVLLSVGVGFWALEEALNLKANVLALLGRNPTLTNRTEVWEILKHFEVNPLIGAGFMSFWTGERLEDIWTTIGASINQAHNGYLEQYLNLGYVGVGFILIIMIVGLWRARAQIRLYPSGGLLRLCFIVAAILYNYTEASFYGINNMWVLLLLGCIEPPPRHGMSVAPVYTPSTAVADRHATSLVIARRCKLAFRDATPEKS